MLKYQVCSSSKKKKKKRVATEVVREVIHPTFFQFMEKFVTSKGKKEDWGKKKKKNYHCFAPAGNEGNRILMI